MSFSVCLSAWCSDCLRGKVRKNCVVPPLVVRVEAARALSVWQNRHAPMSGVVGDRQAWPGLWERLLTAYRERFFDRGGRAVLPNDFKDEADYQVRQAGRQQAGGAGTGGRRPLTDVHYAGVVVHYNS